MLRRDPNDPFDEQPIVVTRARAADGGNNQDPEWEGGNVGQRVACPVLRL